MGSYITNETSNQCHNDQRTITKKHLIEVLLQLKKEGKVRHIGFSTHGSASTIRKLIETDLFEYINLHYHWCGSYTASGTGPYGGNFDNVELAKQKDMGIFIISPYDKGGALYAPSNLLRSLTLPDMEPMTYGSCWGFQHAHTIVCGAARPSDLDQPILDSFHSHRDISSVEQRLVSAIPNWYLGLPNHDQCRYGTMISNIVWIYVLLKSYGMHGFGKDRYGTLQGSSEKWDYEKTKTENIQAMGPAWPWMPGCAFDPSIDYDEDIQQVPNKTFVMEAMRFVHDLYTSNKDIPFEYELAYDMRPWTAYPEKTN